MTEQREPRNQLELWTAWVGMADPVATFGCINVYPVAARQIPEISGGTIVPIEVTEEIELDHSIFPRGFFAVVASEEAPWTSGDSVAVPYGVQPPAEPMRWGMHLVNERISADEDGFKVITLPMLIEKASPETEDPEAAFYDSLNMAFGLSRADVAWLHERSDRIKAWMDGHPYDPATDFAEQAAALDKFKETLPLKRPHGWRGGGPDAEDATIRYTCGKPKTYAIGLSKFTNEIAGRPFQEELTFRTGRDGSKGITVRASLRPDGLAEASEPTLTNFDIEVNERVADAWAETEPDADGRKVLAITPRDINTRISGSDEKPTRKREAEIIESFEKQRHTWVTMEFTRELGSKPVLIDGEEVTGVLTDNPLILASSSKIITKNGIAVQGWVVYEMPPIRYHDMALGQYREFDFETIKRISRYTSATQEGMQLRRYLLMRVAMKPRSYKSKGKEAAQRRIQYTAIIAAVGKTNARKRDRDRVTEKARRIMDALVADGTIKKWREYERHGVVTGIEFERP